MTKLLETDSPTFAEFDEYFIHHFRIQTIYRLVVQKFILRNDKSCYFVVQKARQNPIMIANTVLAVLTKCIGYKDLSQDRCKIFLK